MSEKLSRYFEIEGIDCKELQAIKIMTELLDELYGGDMGCEACQRVLNYLVSRFKD